ncbi:DUF6441 family protein [Sphingomonas sp. DC2300-3]|uniref:DUF6441 family protein n=1 Tax=unclassified Sphingomonas TaxID=196159 RepID=UPI003CE7B49D
MLRPKFKRPDFADAFDGSEADVARFVTEAMSDTTDDVKEAFRDQVRAAGLGDRLANAVRGVAYPNRNGVHSLEPAGWIYAQPSKDGRGAAAIIESYADGRMIVAKNGRKFLAIPTDDCPRKRSGNALTPDEVEQRFGRTLQFISPQDKGFRTPSTRHRAVAYLVLKGLVIRKKTGRWRNASEREQSGKTRNPRPVQAVIMFSLVRSVKKPKSVDLSAPAAIAEQRFESHLNARWR